MSSATLAEPILGSSTVFTPGVEEVPPMLHHETADLAQFTTVEPIVLCQRDVFIEPELGHMSLVSDVHVGSLCTVG
jgi:hypothetical protein